MSITHIELSDTPTQRELARRFIWRASWPAVLLCALITLILIDSLPNPWLNAPARPAAFGGLVSCCMLAVVAVARARHQLAELREAGGVLSEAMISPAPAREFVSPLDPISTFDLCADRLSSIGMAEALGYARPAAFRHNPFTGRITIGRVRPFWREGAVHVAVEQHGSGLTRVQVRRRPGLNRLSLQLGEASSIIDKVCAELERALNTRRAALDTAARTQELERSALQARLHAMQAQVEPHFLYNTLANLKYLIRTDGERAQVMVDHLVGYLQAALPDMRTESSTVGREIDLAEHFLSLMQIRMGERLRFSIEVDPALLECPVPPAMLVSLVENAVKHGLERAARPGHIVVAGRGAERWIELSVRDDGAGLGEAAAGDGVGLANIHQRLQLLYGRAAALRVAPNQGGGVLATLRIPRKDHA